MRIYTHTHRHMYMYIHVYVTYIVGSRLLCTKYVVVSTFSRGVCCILRISLPNILCISQKQIATYGN